MFGTLNGKTQRRKGTVTSWKIHLERVLLRFHWRIHHVATDGMQGVLGNAIPGQATASWCQLRAQKDNECLVNRYPSSPQPASALCLDSSSELRRLNTWPQIKATALSMKRGITLIKMSLNSILQTGSQSIHLWQTSKDRMPFRCLLACE